MSCHEPYQDMFYLINKDPKSSSDIIFYFKEEQLIFTIVFRWIKREVYLKIRLSGVNNKEISVLVYSHNS